MHRAALKIPPRTLAGLALVLLLALAGCQTTAWLGDKFDPRQNQNDRAYQDVVGPYLAVESIYSGPATELHAKALPLTAKVRQAMVERIAQAQGLGPAAQAQRQADQAQDAAQFLEVALSVFVPESKWNDLAAAKPDWRVFLLESGGAEIAPQDIRVIKERSALNEAIYYFWGPWDKLYRLRFALPQGAARLVITGAPGRLELPLKLD
ncbi:MAG: hypothetical protein LDL07_08980, partial [Desulfarculus sp.]|nr:hypothetical protein [Desulfarculus sp.]